MKIIRLRRNLPIFEKLSKTLIKNEIKSTKFRLIKISQELLGLHLLLASSLRFDLWKSLDALTHTKAERWKYRDSEKKLRKILKLKLIDDNSHVTYIRHLSFLGLNSQIKNTNP